MAKILSWHFRHLNIVGCLLERRPTKGGVTGTPGPLPPSYALTTVMYTLDYQPLFGKMAGPGDGGNRAYVK